jgi:curved DNA-binding protein CbpA
MAETFYTVLGVAADADAEAIQHAYRERVKDHHPDVSDEADATEQFKRLTEARDVLLDDAQRSRYDRIGHAAFVTRHLDSTAWTATDPRDGNRGGAGEGRGRRSSGADSWRSPRDTDAGGSWSTGNDDATADDGWDNATNYDRYRSRYADDHDAGDSSSSRRRRRNPFDDAWTDPGDRATAGESDGWGSASDTESASGDRASGDGQAADAADEGPSADDGSWSSDAGWTDDAGSSAGGSADAGASVGADAATGGGQRGDADAWADATTGAWEAAGANRQSTRRGTDTRTRASTDQWKTAHAAANVYRSSGTATASGGAETGAGVGGLRRVLSELGPWLAFHFVFLLGAFVTVWLLLSWTPSVQTMLISLVMLGAAVFFSILHLISRFYA